MMEASRLMAERDMIETEYFQEYLNSILTTLQPSFYCINLIIKVLIHGPDGAGKRLLAKTAAQKLNMNFVEERVADLFDENIIGSEKKIKTSIAKSATSAPCLIYFSGYELFTKLEPPDLNRVELCLRQSFDELQTDNLTQPIAFIAGTSDFQQVFRSPLSDIFQHNFAIRPSSLGQAQQIIKALALESNEGINGKSLLEQYKNCDYYLGNLIDMVCKQRIASYKKSDSDVSDKVREDSTHWADIGGLTNVKSEIVDAIQLCLEYPQLRNSGLKRTGILLYGPPGTGKTLLARAVATECCMNFINIRGPELLNEYVGQSEENIRKLFQHAREASPSVIFFDEIDSLAPNRGQAGDSGGVMDRMVSQLLAEMDGVGKSDGVFVIGATNRVDLVDPSLLRPGRFDKVLEVPLPKDKVTRLQILQSLTRKMKLSKDFDIEKIESLAPPGMSGADFQGLCSKALHRTFDRCIDLVESRQKGEDDVEIITEMDDFLDTLAE